MVGFGGGGSGDRARGQMSGQGLCHRLSVLFGITADINAPSWTPSQMIDVYIVPLSQVRRDCE